MTRAALLAAAGCVAVAYPLRWLSYGSSLARHWRVADGPRAYLGTLQTYAAEVFVETDLVPAGETALAWLGLAALAAAIALAVSDRRATDPLGEEDTA